MQIERNKRHEIVLQYLQDRIIGSQIPVGELLPAEGELAEMFNVSTRTVREAMQVLETKGLIARRHGGRAVVVRNDLAEFIGSLSISIRSLFSTEKGYLLDLMQVRQLIELQVAEQIAQAASRFDLGEIEAALADMGEAANRGDAQRVIDCDAAFHLALIHCFGNDILAVFYENLFGMISEQIKASIDVPRKTLKEAFAEHDELLRLIKSGDGAAARQGFSDHIDGSILNLRTAIGRP